MAVGLEGNGLARIWQLVQQVEVVEVVVEEQNFGFRRLRLVRLKR